ncbi:hypothetical protein DSO57_1028513 [Entomophthora muscae]|uniref:Uncharacterized protein n=1 Tax=Entomophthora muscae TaxID=34485 RepID=A0ACC2SEC7_9FUNG|nr:hypothetical protein DSO57_1028513 [Entomophthora muscae]
MTQVFIDRKKIKETIQEFKEFGSEEVLNIAIAALAFLHTKRVATISLNPRGLHGSFYASEDFNSGNSFGLLSKIVKIS